MSEIIHTNTEDFCRKHAAEECECIEMEMIPEGFAQQCAVSLYKIPPGKSLYRYHYHMKNEEAFYILRGEGILKTPAGEKKVIAGDFLFFPANENGAHKLTNASATQPLVYLDFDTKNDIDVAIYPDSNEMRVWGNRMNQLYNTDDRILESAQ